MTDPVPRFRARAVWLLLALGLTLAAVFDLLVPGNNLYTRDIARVYVAERGALRHAMLDGGLPVWNPLLGGGQPLAANPGYEALYPPQWLVAAAQPAVVFNVEVVGHLLLAAAGMFILVAGAGGHPAAAAFAALSWALGGTLLSTTNLVPFLFSLAWFPWTVHFTRRFAVDRTIRDLALASLTLGAILLIGDQSMILQAGALMATTAFVASRKGGVRRAITPPVLIVIMSILVGAVQILPALDLQKDSGRAKPLEYSVASTWSLSPHRPLELVFPSAFSSMDAAGNLFFWAHTRFDPAKPTPWIFSFYGGLLLGLLIVTGFARRVAGWRVAAAIAGAGTLIALGPRGGVFALLYRAGLSSIRYPEKFFLSAVFALTLFAAATAHAAITRPEVRRTLTRVASVVAGVYVFVLLASLLPGAGAAFTAAWGLDPQASVLITVFRSAWTRDTVFAAALAGLLVMPRIDDRTRLALLFSVLVADLGVRAPWLMPRIESNYYDDPPLAVALRHEPGPVRLFNQADWARYSTPQPEVAPELRPWVIRNGILPSTHELRGIPGILENDVTRTNLQWSIDFADAFWSVSKRRPEQSALLLEMAGVTHVATLKEIPPAVRFDPQKYETVEPVEIRRTAMAGRFYFARALRPAATTRDEFIRAFERPLATGTALTDLGSFEPAPATIDHLEETPSRIAIDVQAAGRTVLVAAVTRHKYWSATLDGREVAIHPANLAFQAIEIPAGKHRVVMTYRNPLVSATAVVSALAAAGLILLACVPASRRPGA